MAALKTRDSARRWATLLERRRGGSSLVLNIAHRGARSCAPENTLEAIAKAAQLGADMVELDVHLTRDGVPVVVHDDDLRRCSDAAVRVPDARTYRCSDWNFEHIRDLDAGSWFAADLERSPSERSEYLQDLSDDERNRHVSDDDRKHFASGRVHLPTLLECIDCARGLRLLLNVEIKSTPRSDADVLARRVVELIETAGAAEVVVVSSFDHQVLLVLRQHSHRLATAVLTSQHCSDPVRLAESLGVDAYHPEWPMLRAAGGVDRVAIEAVHRTGRGVNVWTVNRIADMQALVDAGVAGIITDYPQRLSALLASGAPGHSRFAMRR